MRYSPRRKVLRLALAPQEVVDLFNSSNIDPKIGPRVAHEVVAEMHLDGYEPRYDSRTEEDLEVARAFYFLEETMGRRAWQVQEEVQELMHELFSEAAAEGQPLRAFSSEDLAYAGARQRKGVVAPEQVRFGTVQFGTAQRKALAGVRELPFGSRREKNAGRTGLPFGTAARSGGSRGKASVPGRRSGKGSKDAVVLEAVVPYWDPWTGKPLQRVSEVLFSPRRRQMQVKLEDAEVEEIFITRTMYGGALDHGFVGDAQGEPALLTFKIDDPWNAVGGDPWTYEGIQAARGWDGVERWVSQRFEEAKREVKGQVKRRAARRPKKEPAPPGGTGAFQFGTQGRPQASAPQALQFGSAQRAAPEPVQGSAFRFGSAQRRKNVVRRLTR